MMNCLSRLPNTNYKSVAWIDSTSFPGVRFAIKKVSLGERIELTHRLQDLLLKHDFLQAGTLSEQAEAGLAELLVQNMYLNWGLLAVEGLKIDGRTASAQLLIESGPAQLCAEIFDSLRSRLELSEAERKNS